MIRILIADDHAVVREGVKRILTDTTDIQVVGEVSDGREVLAKLGKQRCDILLLDFAMPGSNGLEVLHQLKRTHPHLPVLMFSMYASQQYVVRAMKAGAAGYLAKESLPAELILAIRKVARGGRYVSQALMEFFIFEMTKDSEEPPHASLSDREYQVLCMLALGKTATAIADELALSVKTISTYRTRILEKMYMKTTAELIHYAIHNQLVE